MILIWVALGGGLGAVMRYLMFTRIDQMHNLAFPVGILTVNVLGSFAMGLLAWTFAHKLSISEEYRAAILFGLLGGFTTFSSFSYNTIEHFIRGDYLSASLNIVLSVVLCIMAAGAGVLLARTLIS